MGAAVPTVVQLDCEAESGVGLLGTEGGGTRPELRCWGGGGTLAVALLSREVHPPVLNAGAVPDRAGEGGEGCGFAAGADETTAHPEEVRGVSVAEPA